MTAKKVDVLVNGGGVAGATIAYALAKSGVKVILVEQTDGNKILNGADLLKPSGRVVLEKYGLLNDILENGGRKRSAVKIFHNGSYVSELDYTRFSELGYFVLIPYENSRKIILDKLASLPTAEIFFNSRIVESEFENDILKYVTLNNGTKICPQVAIGAEGNGSYLRKELVIEVERDVYDQKMYLGKYPMVPSVEEKNRLYVDSRGGLAYFYPIGIHNYRLVIGFPQDEAKNLLADTTGQRLKARLTEFVTESDDALAQVSGTDIFDGIPIARMHAPRYFKGNTVLIGNAIHAIHPITGQGMNLALEDVGILAPALQSYLNGEKTLENTLNYYQKTRYPINEKVVSYGHRLATTYHKKEAFSSSLDLKIQGSSRDQDSLRLLQSIPG
jgi:HQNO biosynthesis monooxygenase PqsL